MTTSTQAIVATTEAGEQLLARLQNLVPAGAIPKAERKTTKDVNPQSKAKDGLYSENDKQVLGIPEENNITWAHPNFDWMTGERLKNIAKSLDMKTDEFLTSIIMTWVHDNEEAIVDLAGDIASRDTSEEKLQRELEASQRKIERLVAALEAHKAKAS